MKGEKKSAVETRTDFYINMFYSCTKCGNINVRVYGD